MREYKYTSIFKLLLNLIKKIAKNFFISLYFISLNLLCQI